MDAGRRRRQASAHAVGNRAGPTNPIDKHPAYVELERLAWQFGLAALSHRGAR